MEKSIPSRKQTDWLVRSILKTGSKRSVKTSRFASLLFYSWDQHSWSALATRLCFFFRNCRYVDISLDFSFLYSVYFFVQNCMVYSCFLFVFLSVFAHMISLSFSTCLSFLPSFFLVPTWLSLFSFFVYNYFLY